MHIIFIIIIISIIVVVAAVAAVVVMIIKDKLPNPISGHEKPACGLHTKRAHVR